MTNPLPMKIVASKRSPAELATTSYEECRRNHAASIGKYAVDGCREFMPSGEEGSGAAFRCAACGCHRNFHRKVVRRHPPLLSLLPTN